MNLFLLVLIACALTWVTPNSTSAQNPTTPAELRKQAGDYYRWRNQNYPVSSSDSGLHTWDDRLTDYSLSAILDRRLHLKEVPRKAEAIPGPNWTQADRIHSLL